MSSCNLQFFLELFTTQLREFHMVSPHVVSTLACIVSKPLLSCLWGYGEYVNPPKLHVNIQEVQGALSSRPVGDPFFRFFFFYFCQTTPLIHVHVILNIICMVHSDVEFRKEYLFLKLLILHVNTLYIPSPGWTFTFVYYGDVQDLTKKNIGAHRDGVLIRASTYLD